ncbi:MAG TPA: hypothetical protein VHS78_00490 [Candidatus Elarobacter sp.]|jgi:hypothetical protein|nr:hypothetical protein [Candidatus Elarobacter sp.]
MRVAYGNVLMAIPQGGAHVREVEIRVPAFSGPPAITATVFSPHSPGPAFAVYNIQAQPLEGQTQIVIAATNVEKGVPQPYDYYCSYVIIGPS